MDCFHRHIEHRDMDDAHERGSTVKGHGRPVTFHPKFIPTINVYADGAAQNATLEQFVVAQREDPLRGEARGIEDRDTDVGDCADHDIGEDWINEMRENRGL